MPCFRDVIVTNRDVILLRLRLTAAGWLVGCGPPCRKDDETCPTSYAGLLAGTCRCHSFVESRDYFLEAMEVRARVCVCMPVCLRVCVAVWLCCVCVGVCLWHNIGSVSRCCLCPSFVRVRVRVRVRVCAPRTNEGLPAAKRQAQAQRSVVRRVYGPPEGGGGREGRANTRRGCRLDDVQVA